MPEPTSSSAGHEEVFKSLETTMSSTFPLDAKIINVHYCGRLVAQKRGHLKIGFESRILHFYQSCGRFLSREKGDGYSLNKNTHLKVFLGT